MVCINIKRLFNNKRECRIIDKVARLGGDKITQVDKLMYDVKKKGRN